MIVPTNRQTSILCCAADGSSLAYIDTVDLHLPYSWIACSYNPSVNSIPVSKQTDKPLMLLCDVYVNSEHIDLVILDDVTREYSLGHVQRLANINFIDNNLVNIFAEGQIYVNSISMTPVYNHPILHDWFFITDHMNFKVSKSDFQSPHTALNSIVDFSHNLRVSTVPNSKVEQSIRLTKTSFPEIYRAPDDTIAFIPTLECALFVFNKFKSVNADTIEINCKLDTALKRWVPIL